VNARDIVLARIRSALDGAPAAPAAARNYRTQTGGPAGSQQVVDRFIDRLADYGAQVRPTTSDRIPDTIAEALSGAASAVLPPKLPPSWRGGV
jgi:L-lactate dehydrogenase complex protein LldG